MIQSQPQPESVKFSVLAKFQEKQVIAWHTILNPDAKYILYGGSAGGGKSYFLRWAALGLAIYYFGKYGIRRVPIGLFSEDYPTLRDRQITKIMREFPKEFGELKDSQRDGLAYILAPELGSGVIMLRNLDDPSKYASVEFAAILVEELTKNTEDKFEHLRTRMRFPGIEDRKFIGATNPGEIGHGWVKRKWVKPDTDHPDLEQDRFFFVPARYTDNQYNPSDYGMQLMAISDPQRRRALLDGDWDVFAGQYFEEWRPDMHVCEDFAPHPKSIIVGGMDWGRSSRESHKTAFYFSLDVVTRVSLKDETTNVDSDISWWRTTTFLEVAGKEKTPEDWDWEIQKALRELGLSIDNIAWVRADPAMFKKKEDGSISIADQFIQSDGRWQHLLQKANNDRVPGWEILHKWLSVAPDDKPYWQICERCKNLIRTLPELIHDENNPEDLDSEGEDHPADGERYKHVHLKWIDARLGGVKTDTKPRYAPRPLVSVNTSEGPKQISIDLDRWAIDRKTPSSTRVISSSS